MHTKDGSIGKVSLWLTFLLLFCSLYIETNREGQLYAEYFVFFSLVYSFAICGEKLPDRFKGVGLLVAIIVSVIVAVEVRLDARLGHLLSGLSGLAVPAEWGAVGLLSVLLIYLWNRLEGCWYEPQSSKLFLASALLVLVFALSGLISPIWQMSKESSEHRKSFIALGVEQGSFNYAALKSYIDSDDHDFMAATGRDVLVGTEALLVGLGHRGELLSAAHRGTTDFYTHSLLDGEARNAFVEIQVYSQEHQALFSVDRTLSSRVEDSMKSLLVLHVFILNMLTLVGLSSLMKARR
ncbi:hypothetical protein AB4254_12280 [Vibrio breoganii]